MKRQRLLPEEIEACIEDLVMRVAEVHADTGENDTVRILVEDVTFGDFPAGDYEVVVRQKKPPLSNQLKTLDNPWMRVFGK